MTAKPEQLARDRAALEVVVGELVRRHDRMTATQSLAAAAVTVLEVEGGPALAARYLRELADDVAQAGGWKNHAVLATLYQQPDDATLYRVVSEPAELREAKA